MTFDHPVFARLELDIIPAVEDEPVGRASSTRRIKYSGTSFRPVDLRAGLLSPLKLLARQPVTALNGEHLFGVRLWNFAMKAGYRMRIPSQVH